MSVDNPKFYPHVYLGVCLNCGNVVEVRCHSGEKVAQGIARSRHKCPVEDEIDEGEFCYPWSHQDFSPNEERLLEVFMLNKEVDWTGKKEYRKMIHYLIGRHGHGPFIISGLAENGREVYLKGFCGYLNQGDTSQTPISFDLSLLKISS